MANNVQYIEVLITLSAATLINGQNAHSIQRKQFTIQNDLILNTRKLRLAQIVYQFGAHHDVPLQECEFAEHSVNEK